MQHNSFDVIFSRLQTSFSLEAEKAAFANTKTRDELRMIKEILGPATPIFPISCPKTKPIRLTRNVMQTII